MLFGSNAQIISPGVFQWNTQIWVCISLYSVISMLQQKIHEILNSYSIQLHENYIIQLFHS